MRKLTSFIAAMLISASATFAQAPQGFSYQAVVRDAQNAIVANQTVEVTLTILQGTTADFAQAVFSEKHNAKTNANGLFTLIVGSVEPEKFATINWAAGNVFLKTETDYGTSVTQMLSVPFALYAAKAAEADVDLSGYALKSDIPAAPDLSGYALKTEIPAETDLSGYAKTADIENVYAKKTDIPAIPTKISELQNDANYLTAHQSLADYAKKTDIPAALDLSAYAKTTDIEAAYAKKADIPAVPTKISELQNDANFLTAHQSLADYAKKADIPAAPDLSAYALKTEIPTDANLSGYYSKAEVDALLANISSGLGDNTVSVTAGDNGTVKGASGKFFSGQSLTYTATPNDGYYFSGWSDGDNANPRTILIYKNITLSAQFSQNPLVTISAGDNGTVNTGVNGRYTPGSSITITATPAEGYYFSGWSDGNYLATRSIEIGTSDIELSASFATTPIITTIDLGLTSGILWATCNLGANSPDEYGNYYAWGETETESYYDWSTYQHCNGSNASLTKYCNISTLGKDGFTDDLTTLESADDAATSVFGSEYSIPTAADWNELCDQCYWVWTDSYNGTSKAGYIVYKTKSVDDKGLKVYKGNTPSVSYTLSDAHIFLPIAGYRFYSTRDNLLSGFYWSASLDEMDPSFALSIYFLGSNVNPSFRQVRFYGHSVRPVRRTN
ncbi:MAG: hypothetical protein J6W13_12555 [Salinivirgaceae bacterium]|nr:hypothetical protein [Salinivirgaceae bacterium]